MAYSSFNGTRFSFLSDRFNVLVADDDWGSREPLVEPLKDHYVFSPVVAATAREAASHLDSGTIHMCLLDLGLFDINKDELYIVKEYGRKLPVIIVSGCSSMAKAKKCIDLGAVATVDKPAIPYRGDLNCAIREALFRKVFWPWKPHEKHADFDRVYGYLCAHKPESVDAWAGGLDTEPRQLRRVWRHLDAEVRYILKTYLALDLALDCFGDWSSPRDCDARSCSRRRLCDIVQEFVLTHKTIFDRLTAPWPGPGARTGPGRRALERSNT
ncbi:MAG: response regulator [Chitinivibrionales bacterium]|nr:response regulator [Chitinivibrionales bacterium]MBD3397289.1 response regulator [Chitinivibrionales bacterium]